MKNMPKFVNGKKKAGKFVFLESTNNNDTAENIGTTEKEKMPLDVYKNRIISTVIEEGENLVPDTVEGRKKLLKDLGLTGTSNNQAGADAILNTYNKKR